MAGSVSRFRCLHGISSPSPFRVFLPQTSAPTQLRSFATATSEPPSIDSPTSRPRVRPTSFADKLNAGPSFSDFVGGNEPPLDPSEAYALKTALVGPKGKQKEITRLPSWLKTPIPDSSSYKKIKADLRGLNLHTVCEEARCPNMSDCWGGSKSAATATIMLLGDTCTRGCRFCAVKTSRTPNPLDPTEPDRVAKALETVAWDYVVLTSVNRDDLADGGANQFARTIEKIKKIRNSP